MTPSGQSPRPQPVPLGARHVGPTVFADPSDLKQQVGSRIGPSEWFEVTQEAISGFADASGDHQWIHVDSEKAAEGPFGTTICHGLLTLALGQTLARSVYRVEGTRMGINYGLNKVRFPSPLPVGSRVRTAVDVLDVSDHGDSWQVTTRVTTEREGAPKPVCVAESVVRLYP